MAEGGHVSRKRSRKNPSPHHLTSRSRSPLLHPISFKQWREEGRDGLVIDNTFFCRQERLTIAESKKILCKEIKKCLKKLGRCDEFYIGRTYIDKIGRAQNLDLEDYSTWDLKGLRRRYGVHHKKSYGKNGLFVIAVFDETCVPPIDIENETIMSHEEYVIILERRLIQAFEDNDRRANVGAECGKFSEGHHGASVIYITCTLEGEYVPLCCTLSHLMYCII